MTRPVHLVAMGARTPVGTTAKTSAASVRAGISRLRTHPFMVDATGEKLSCACDPGLDPGLFGAERLLPLAHHALVEVIAELTRQGSLHDPLPVLLALPEPRPGHAEADAAWIARDLAAQPLPDATRVTVQCVGEGHAGALAALESAVAQVADGAVDVAVAGGVDSYFQADTLDWLDAERRIARAEVRSGFPPGEGAGMIAVASDGARARLGLPSLARVRGVATTQEPRSIDSDEGLLGEGLTAALRQATASLVARRERVDAIYCDINGERHRTDEWGFTILRNPSLFRDATAYTSPVGEWGDMGAAGGALHVVLAVQAWQRRYATGPLALVWGSSWSGLRAVALLEAGEG